MTAHLHYRHTCTQRSASQIRLAGLVVAFAFGDMQRLLWSKSNQRQSNQPAKTQAQAGTTVRRSTRENSGGNGSRESSNLSPAPELKIERLEVPLLKNFTVVVRGSTSGYLCSARKRCVGNTRRWNSRASSYTV